MFDTKLELLEKIRLVEDSYLELKEVRFAGDRVTGPIRESLADELAGFANSRGGVCLLGVDDRQKEILGIPPEQLDRVETYVRGICNDLIDPPLAPLIERLNLPSTLGTDLPVIKVDIPRSLFVHRSPGGYFHRIGSSKREMQPEYLARLFQQLSQARIIRFDEQTVPMASLDDLSERLWQRFSPAQPPADEREVFLGKLGFSRQDESGASRPTISGVLMATEDPRRFLPNAFIQAVAYRGDGSAAIAIASGYQLDAADITGPLDEQVAGALRFVARNMRIEARKAIGRTDYPQYDLAAVFEALVNAAAHRDYSIYGSKIRLRMYSDRLELFSPGSLANTMTIDSLSLRQSARNELLTSLLARCPVPKDIPGFHTDRTTMMDRRGEGVRVIFQQTELLAGRLPEYRLIDQEELQLIIPAASAGSSAE